MPYTMASAFGSDGPLICRKNYIIRLLIKVLYYIKELNLKYFCVIDSK